MADQQHVIPTLQFVLLIAGSVALAFLWPLGALLLGPGWMVRGVVLLRRNKHHQQVRQQSWVSVATGATLLIIVGLRLLVLV